MNIDSEFHDLEKSIKKDHLDQIILFQFEYFEMATQESVKNLKDSYKDAKENYEIESSKLVHIDENNVDDITEEEWEKIDEVGQYYQEMDFSLEYPNSLLEMIIVYLFKNLEIIIKHLIKTAYHTINTKDFYNWMAMKSFFRTKGINICDLEGYNDCVDTLKLNNSIKHSDTYNEEVFKIAEMSNEEELLYSRLEKFYARAKPKVEIFAQQLKEAIKNDLYSFSDDRLSNIAKEFKDRMDVHTLNKLIEKLK